MDVSELARVAHEEGLDTPVICGAGQMHADAVVVDRVGVQWRVYLVDERHAPIEHTIRTYNSEPEALERVLLKLRQVARANASRSS